MGAGVFAGGLAQGVGYGVDVYNRGQAGQLAKAKDQREGEYYKKIGDILDAWRAGKLPHQQQGPEQLAGPGGPPAPGNPAAGGMPMPAQSTPMVTGAIPTLNASQQQKKPLPFSEFMGF